MTFDFDKAMDDAWEGALQILRDEGKDVEAILEQGAANLTAWRELRDTDPERHARLMAKSHREWVEWEMTVDDMGRPQYQSPGGATCGDHGGAPTLDKGPHA